MDGIDTWRIPGQEAVSLTSLKSQHIDYCKNMDQLKAFTGHYNLQCWPVKEKERLRAWDAADEYVLQHLSEHNLNKPRTLIINDQFGALTTCLNQFAPVNWSDSYISHASAKHNIALNQQPSKFTSLAMTDRPEGKFGLIIIKVPKSNALLEYQLKLISTLVNKDTLLIGAGMSRHIHNSTLSLFDEIIGSTKTSLAVKKARLIFSTCTHIKQQTELPVPSSYYQEDLQLQLSNQANVFSREKLDIGARFMIEQFSQLPRSRHIIDLACGNGVLGIIAKRYLGDCSISFIDESYMAISSARTNYEAEYDDNDTNFYVDDCLSNSKARDIDLILCNPPFHQQHSTGDETAWRMFIQSKKNLDQGGQLWVVGNRHMNYHNKLQRIFGNCHIVASNKKFIVLSCQS